MDSHFAPPEEDVRGTRLAPPRVCELNGNRSSLLGKPALLDCEQSQFPIPWDTTDSSVAQANPANRRFSHEEGRPLARPGHTRKSVCSSLNGSDNDIVSSHARGSGPSNGRSSTFADIQEMKRRVRDNLSKQKYDVRDFYKTVGIWQYMARHPLFEKTVFFVIGVNAIWIAIDTDVNTADVILESHPVFQIAENMFCAFFLFEWVVRALSFKRAVSAAKDSWFVFDGIMVITMVSETWVFSSFVFVMPSTSGGPANTSVVRVARLLRLSRMFRMARLLRAMPELLILIKGLLAAARSVFFTLVLLVIILFVYAICFRQLTAKTNIGDTYFTSVAHSMVFLVMHGTLLLSTDYKIFELQKEDKAICGGFGLNVVFFSFILVAAVLLMNMLIGVLCEMVSVVAATEKEEMLVSYVDMKLREVMLLIDEDGGGTISRDEFMQILDNMDAMRALQEVGVDVVGLVDFADFIFGGDDAEAERDEEQKELTLSEFMEVVLQLRGSNNATVKDIVDLRKFVRNELVTNAKKVDLALEDCAAMKEQLAEVLRSLRALRTMEDDGARTSETTPLQSPCQREDDGARTSETTPLQSTRQREANASVKSLVAHPLLREADGALHLVDECAAVFNVPAETLAGLPGRCLGGVIRNGNAVHASGLRFQANTDQVKHIEDPPWQAIEKKPFPFPQITNTASATMTNMRNTAQIRSPLGSARAPLAPVDPADQCRSPRPPFFTDTPPIAAADFRGSWCVIEAEELRGVVERLGAVLAKRTSDLEKAISHAALGHLNGDAS